MQARHAFSFEMRSVSTIPCWFFSFQWDEKQEQCNFGLTNSYKEFSKLDENELIRKGIGPMCLPSTEWKDIFFGIHYHTSSLPNKDQHEWESGSKLDLIDKQQEKTFSENFQFYSEEKKKFPPNLLFEESHKQDKVDRSEIEIPKGWIYNIC